jgi:glycerophosphoryl diester phosphodiesterase
LLAGLIRRERFENECIVTSFDHGLADEIKKLVPELTVGYIFSKKEFHERLFSGAAEILSAHHKLITKEFMKKARAKNKQVHAWTVDRPSDASRMRELEIDAIITNFPDRLTKP